MRMKVEARLRRFLLSMRMLLYSWFKFSNSMVSLRLKLSWLHGYVNPNMSKSYLNTAYLRAREDARGFTRKEERKG